MRSACPVSFQDCFVETALGVEAVLPVLVEPELPVLAEVVLPELPVLDEPVLLVPVLEEPVVLPVVPVLEVLGLAVTALAVAALVEPVLAELVPEPEPEVLDFALARLVVAAALRVAACWRAAWSMATSSAVAVCLASAVSLTNCPCDALSCDCVAASLDCSRATTAASNRLLRGGERLVVARRGLMGDRTARKLQGNDRGGCTQADLALCRRGRALDRQTARRLQVERQRMRAAHDAGWADRRGYRHRPRRPAPVYVGARRRGRTLSGRPGWDG